MSGQAGDFTNEVVITDAMIAAGARALVLDREEERSELVRAVIVAALGAMRVDTRLD